MSRARYRRYLFDIETDNLLETVSKFHCGVIYDLDTSEMLTFEPGQGEAFIRELGRADELYGHNIISYDIPALYKLFPDESMLWLDRFRGLEGDKVLDTMVMSRTIWSDVKSMDWENAKKGSLELPQNAQERMKVIGGHSLKAWGYRLKFLKGNFGAEIGFEEYVPEMLEYCKRDVLVNVKLIQTIWSKEPSMAEPLGEIPYFIWLEHQFYTYLQVMQNAGVEFDVPYATLLCKYWNLELEKRVAELRRTVPDVVRESEIVPKVNNSKLGYVKGVPFVKRKVVPFNPRSNDHVISFLVQRYQWQPTTFTKKGQKPEITYDILKSLPYPEAPLLARIKLLMDRLKTVEKSGAKNGSAYLQVARPVGNGHRIYGGIIHNGTPTSRCRHMRPNLGNIASSSAIWGLALRKCFKAKDGYKLVGTDFDSLEMRCMSEVLWPYDNGAFYRMAFSGTKEAGTDAHSLNRDAIHRLLMEAGHKQAAQEMTGKGGRGKAKTAFYAAIYGAWPRKLGSVICEGTDIPESRYTAIGKCVQEGFYANIKGLKELTQTLEEAFDECLSAKKWPHIVGLDGRRIPIRKKSALFNSLLQSMGAILSKVACVYKMHDLKAAGLELGRDWQPVLHVHDETQDEVFNEGQILSDFQQVVARCFTKSGEHFGLRVPIIGEPAVGNNWKETH